MFDKAVHSCSSCTRAFPPLISCQTPARPSFLLFSSTLAKNESKTTRVDCAQGNLTLSHQGLLAHFNRNGDVPVPELSSLWMVGLCATLLRFIAKQWLTSQCLVLFSSGAGIDLLAIRHVSSEIPFLPNSFSPNSFKYLLASDLQHIPWDEGNWGRSSRHAKHSQLCSTSILRMCSHVQESRNYPGLQTIITCIQDGGRCCLVGPSALRLCLNLKIDLWVDVDLQHSDFRQIPPLYELLYVELWIWQWIKESRDVWSKYLAQPPSSNRGTVLDGS